MYGSHVCIYNLHQYPSIYYTELKILKCPIPASAPASRDAVQASGDAQVPGVRQVRVRRRGDAGGRPEVAQGELSLVNWHLHSSLIGPGLLQVQHVQQDAGLHQQQRQGQRALLQGGLIIFHYGCHVATS